MHTLIQRRLKWKGLLLYSAVSSALDSSKHFTLHPPQTSPFQHALSFYHCLDSVSTSVPNRHRRDTLCAQRLRGWTLGWSSWSVVRESPARNREEEEAWRQLVSNEDWVVMDIYYWWWKGCSSAGQSSHRTMSADSHLSWRSGRPEQNGGQHIFTISDPDHDNEHSKLIENDLALLFKLFGGEVVNFLSIPYILKVK